MAKAAVACSFRAVTLAEVIEQLEDLDKDATIYAAKPWGPDAQAVVAVESEDGAMSVSAGRLYYFLEVDIALEAARASSAGTPFHRVLHYAENEAFLFDV
jgi:hypothetical protein